MVILWPSWLPLSVRGRHTISSWLLSTRYHQELFARQGVRRDKIVVVPQPADLDFFNPARTAPIELPGTQSGVCCARLCVAGGEASSIESNLVWVVFFSGAKPESFRFFSIMEWEHRKGWDLLLRAFLSEFSRDEEVPLPLLLLGGG